MQQPFELQKYAGKQGSGVFRNPISVDEMAAHCTASHHIWFKSMAGDARRAKVNGAVRRWKRDPGRIAVPLKYGLYECGTLTADDIDRVLIPVVPPTAGNAPVLSAGEPCSGLSPTLSRSALVQ